MDEKILQIEARDKFVCAIKERHHEVLFMYALGLCKRFRYCPSYADDVMQEFYWKVLRFYENTEAGYATNGIGFLRVMLRNELLGLDRKHKSLSRLGKIYHGALPRTSELGGLATDPLIDEFEKMIVPYLSEKDARIMKLYVEGYSHEEIGQMLGMKPSTAGVRIHRAKKTLAPHFEGWWRKRKPRIH
ncbi:MAG: sigma-70 family RNA polymerase sigma factor [Phaeodactylibacter sp.]|nr:sigma-70 family RNA polymerase sigma factor [Phaeodactylibacter sp.]